MSEMITVGEAIARTLEQYNVEAIYGVISIHNLPIADAVGQRGNIRFVPARGEAGSVTMADAHGRFSGLGVALTSTGAGAGNAVGALVEAMNACTPLLHLTGQVVTLSPADGADALAKFRSNRFAGLLVFAAMLVVGSAP